MTKSIGIFVDNNFNHDIRVNRQVFQYIRLGYKVCVLCFEYTSEDSKYDDNHPFDICRIRLSKKIRNGLKILDGRTNIYYHLTRYLVGNFLKSYKVDLLHVHDLYLSKPSAAAIKKNAKHIALIVDLHENYPEAVKHYAANMKTLTKWFFNSIRWEKKEKSYLTCCQAIVTLSTDFKNQLIKRNPEIKNHKFISLPNYLDIAKFETKQQAKKVVLDWKNPENPVFVYFGVIAKRRGVNLTIEAFNHLHLEGIKPNLLLIGPIDKTETILFQKDSIFLKNNGAIQHIPWIDINELKSYLNLADVALCPLEKNKQHESGIANKIFQYMYCSLPIISSSCKPQQDLIEENQIGSIFHDLNSYKNAIKKHFDHELNSKMGKRALQALKEKYDYQTTDNRLKNLIDILIT